MIALGALAVAIETFAIAQAITGDTSGCTAAASACVDPVALLALVTIGALAMVAAVVPAIGWMRSAAREQRAESAEAVARDLVSVRAARARSTEADDDDL